MRKFLTVAAVVVLAGLASAGKADAQVIGTGGPYAYPGPSLGYYSPYPGALYSPFRQAPAVTGFYAGPTYYNPGFYTRPAYYGPGFGTSRYGHPGSYYQPSGMPGSYWRR